MTKATKDDKPDSDKLLTVQSRFMYEYVYIRYTNAGVLYACRGLQQQGGEQTRESLAAKMSRVCEAQV